MRVDAENRLVNTAMLTEAKLVAEIGTLRQGREHPLTEDQKRESAVLRPRLVWARRRSHVHEFEKPRTGQHRFVTDVDLVETVCALARVESDARIAAILNRNQRRTAHGETWTAKYICSLRNNHGIAVYREGERQARNEMSVSEVAGKLGVTDTTVLWLIRPKRLPATHACSGAPWVLRKSDIERYTAERTQPATPPTADSKQLNLETPSHL
jgi:excisionase family DNA binding protein